CAPSGLRRRSRRSRQLALAAQPQMLVGLELGHAQQIMQHVELVALGELAQCSDLLGDEGDSLLDAALPRFLVAQASPRARRGARSFVPRPRHQTPPESMPRRNSTPTPATTPRWYSAT